MDALPFYIGWDAREDRAYRVAEASLRQHSTIPLTVTPLRLAALRQQGLYWRQAIVDNTGQRVDRHDGQPFSTDFAFSRFLVPQLQNYQGWAVFCDCDFLFRCDVADLLDYCANRYAVVVVKHQHQPLETSKMDNQVQTAYPRKNWSSFILWNCAHPAHQALTLHAVNTWSGRQLHSFSWVPDKAIGSLPVAWNWLEGSSDSHINPHAVHFTRGGPWFPDYQNVAYAAEWLALDAKLAAAA